MIIVMIKCKVYDHSEHSNFKVRNICNQYKLKTLRILCVGIVASDVVVDYTVTDDKIVWPLIRGNIITLLYICIVYV